MARLHSGSGSRDDRVSAWSARGCVGHAPAPRFNTRRVLGNRARGGGIWTCLVRISATGACASNSVRVGVDYRLRSLGAQVGLKSQFRLGSTQ
jgi:hypothetical protein